jgi:Tfp pilus assembly protein PilZ
MSIRYRMGAAGDGYAAWVVAETRDIGVGGAFIAAVTTEPVGSHITIEIELPTTDRTFELPGIVRWVRDAGDDDDGMGIQFVGVDVNVLLELNDYFATIK